MTYALCQDDDGAFAIALRNGHTGEQAVTQDITPDPVAALALYDLLVRRRNPVTFRDVVEDF